MELALVAAVAANGVIGADGTMPWHYPEDLDHFKQTTTGHPVIMGRRTFESVYRELGSPLPDRRNIVLSSRPDQLPDGVAGVTSLNAAVADAAATGVSTTYVIGGGTVYEQFLPRADELILTELDDAFAGDSTFPSVEWNEWTVVDREPHDDFEIVWYRRRSAD